MDGPRNLASYLEEFSSLRPLPEKLERNVDTERRVIEAYLSNLSADWVALVRRLCEALPAMAPQTRLSVLIPARLEAFRLPRCLAALEQESRSLRRSDPNVLEVIVLDNRRKSDAPDHTADAIALWTAHAKAESLPVSRVVHVWNDDERFCLPKARKLLADVALMRAIERPTAIGPLYLISEDADVEDIEPNRSAEFVRRFDALPWLDALRGRQDRTPSVLADNHLLLLERRSWYFTETLLSAPALRPARWENANFHWNRVVTGGWNTAFTAQGYAAIRGYSTDVELFEDMDIGQRLSVLRGHWRGKRFVPEVDIIGRIHHRAHSSAARALLAWGEDRHIYDHGAGFEAFVSVGDRLSVRRSDIAPLLRQLTSLGRVSTENAGRYARVLEQLRDEILRILEDNDRADRLLDRVMALCGFPNGSYHTDSDGCLTIDDFSRFKELASAFSCRHGTYRQHSTRRSRSELLCTDR